MTVTGAKVSWSGVPSGALATPVTVIVVGPGRDRVEHQRGEQARAGRAGLVAGARDRDVDAAGLSCRSRREARGDAPLPHERAVGDGAHAQDRRVVGDRERDHRQPRRVVDRDRHRVGPARDAELGARRRDDDLRRRVGRRRRLAGDAEAACGGRHSRASAASWARAAGGVGCARNRRTSPARRDWRWVPPAAASAVGCRRNDARHRRRARRRRRIRSAARHRALPTGGAGTPPAAGFPVRPAGRARGCTAGGASRLRRDQLRRARQADVGLRADVDRCRRPPS